MRGLREIKTANSRAAEREDKATRMIRVMVRIMRSELDYHGMEELSRIHPELKGISEEELREYLDAGETFEA